jgi:8-oxo-dGTP diphosphatase
MEEPSIRQVARVILLDRAKNVLLVKYEETESMHPDGEGPLVYWVPPGGKLESNEDYQSAASRELLEESGLSVEIGPCIWKRKHRLRYLNELIMQEERFFLSNIDDQRPPVSNQSPEDIVEVRWWSVDEMEKSSAVFFPEGLKDLIKPIIEVKIPSNPVNI